VLLVTAMPLAAGFFRLGTPSIWFDEAATWLNVSDGWRWMWLTAVSGEDCGGFVYALIMKLWTSAFGYDEIALRAPSVIFAAAAACALLELGRGMGNLRAGVAMALCVAPHPFVLYWSRQARGYTLEIFLAAAYLAILLSYGRVGGKLRAATLTLVGALLALTHVFGVFVVAGGTLFLLALRFDRSAESGVSRSRTSLVPSILAGLTWACWVYAMQNRVKKNIDTFFIDGTMAQGYADVFQKILPFYGVAAVLVVAGAGLLLVRFRLPLERRLLLAAGFILLTVTAGPAAASMLSRGTHHFILPRYFMPAVVPIAVFAGYLLAALPRRLSVVGVLVFATAGVSTATFRGAYSDAAIDGSRMRAAMQYLAGNFRKGDRLFISPAYEEATLRYYRVPSAIVRGAGQYGEREKLKEMLSEEPPQPGARNWVLICHCDDADDLGAISLANRPQERFGTSRLVRVDGPSAAGAEAVAAGR
jgi:mannosyltransferase